MVDRLYPSQTHRKTVSDLLTDATKAWLEAGANKNDQPTLEAAARQFLTQVEERIRSLVVLVPIEGLEANFSEDVEIARCRLSSNSPRSQLMLAISQARERVHRNEESPVPAEQASAYFSVAVQSHFGRALKRAGAEVELALNVIRLYRASFYFDIHNRSVPRQMGIVGTRHEGRYGSMYVLRGGHPVEDQSPGFQESFRHVDSYEINNAVIKSMRAHGLDRINKLLTTAASGGGGETSRSLLRAIDWFGKATTAMSMAESFLMYVISIEALLSRGDRTPKESYAERIAALVTRQDDVVVFPVDGYLSRPFSQTLKSAANQSARRARVYDRAVKLFGIRNDIAHGAKVEAEIDTVDLLDCETLIRNAILSFVDGGWDTLADFKKWMAKR